MVKKLSLLIALSLSGLRIWAQENPISYTVSLNNAVHHEAQISLVIPKPPQDSFVVKMARSSPGRYATHEFGKNIYDVLAYQADGKQLKIKQIEGDAFQISGHQGSVKITYTLFGNRVDGTYAGIDHRHAHLNIPASFMFVPALQERPIDLKILLPNKQWQVYTQLPVDSGVYKAKNLQYFMDSPIEISSATVKSFDVLNKEGSAQKIKIVYHGTAADSTLQDLTLKTKKIVKEAEAVFGELPQFDFKEYTFLIDVLPSNTSDGMEHRNSTVIPQQAANLESSISDVLSTISHEFFHAWNVERIRPKTLEPFNFEKANMSDELWFAEGFTQYYGELLQARAGVTSIDDFLNNQGYFLNSVLNSPGANRYSPLEISRRAVFVDAGVAIDPTNNHNIYSSYYLYGNIIALALDLSLQSQFNLSLDDYMKLLWQKHGKTEIPYTIADLQQTLASLTSDDFAKTFFTNYIYGIQKPNYRALMAKAGYDLNRTKPFAAYVGNLRLNPENGKLKLLSPALFNTPIYDAGIEAGDYILSADSTNFSKTEDFEAYLKTKKPGEQITLTYERDGKVKNTLLTLTYNPTLGLNAYEKLGIELTPEIIAFREKWLKSKSTE